MALVQVADIYEPEVWADYMAEQPYRVNRLLQSGIAYRDPAVEANANGGGTVIDMPFWQALSHGTGATDVSKIPTDDENTITPAKASTGKDIAVKQFRTQSWKTSSTVHYVAGSDPVAHFLNGYAEWWATDFQANAISSLTGIFATALASTHVVNAFTEDGVNATADELIGSSTIQDARFKLGDNFTDIAGIIMHSTVYKRLENLNQITFLPASDQLAKPISMYGSLQVVIDDSVPVVAGGVSGYKYTSYLFKKGALALVPVALGADAPNAEWYRLPKESNGAGTNELITRQQFVLHPRGVAFSGTPAGLYPTNAELESGANWTKAYQDKGIGLVKLVTNG